MFQKATKRSVKARVALDGPTGAGKTWTALTWATALGHKIAVVDTERGSASLYSDRFDFDVLEMTPPYEPGRLVEALLAAEKAGYDVVIVDSLSHFWEGEGGTLDIADAAGQRAQGNSFAGWKVATPVLRHLVDVMLGLDAHLLVTMRSKMEWVIEEYVDKDGRKKSKPTKLGMAPVMRAGVEYEFQVIGDLDLEHRLTITKSRCEPLADQVFQPGRALEGAETFGKWLSSGEAVATRNETDALVARMNRLDDETRKACKAAFADRFGRPAALLESRLAEAQAFVAGYENDIPTPPPAADPTPKTDPDLAVLDAVREANEARDRAPAGDAPEPDPATTAAPPQPEDTAAAAAPPADGPLTFTQRVALLPTDLAETVRADEKAIRARGVEAKSEQHIAEAEAALADAEKAQNKRARDVVLAINAGAKTVWNRPASDDERHQLLLTFTDGAVASAKRVTADQLRALKKRVRDWQNGAIALEQRETGEYSIREAVAS